MEGGGALLAWPTTVASPQITMEIHISNWTHKFQNKTGLDDKANSELYKSNQVNSVPSLNSLTYYCPISRILFYLITFLFQTSPLPSSLFPYTSTLISLSLSLSLHPSPSHLFLHNSSLTPGPLKGQ